MSVGGDSFGLCAVHAGGKDHGASTSTPVEKALGMFTVFSVQTL